MKSKKKVHEHNTSIPLHGASCGVDEAGRGALAGPIVAAAVVLPDEQHGMKGLTGLKGLTDSKMLSAKQRERLYSEITQSKDIIWAVGVVGVGVIDEINILQATMLAMHDALGGVSEKMSQKPQHIWVDGNYFRSTEFTNVTTVVEGDKLYPCISAASIVAKVTRDHWMRDVADVQFPDYGFARHKGYATKVHREAILQHGACELHRRLFLRNVLGLRA